MADIFETDFSKADVVTMFLLTSLNLKLRPTILDMKPGTRVVSNTFDMGDWKADEVSTSPTAAPPTAGPISGSCRPRSTAPGPPTRANWSLEQRYQMSPAR